MMMYQQIIVEVLTPSANARAWRTFRMIVNVTVLADKLSGIPRLASDLMAGELPMRMSTSINGRVKILSIKKSVGIQMNCSMVVVLQTQDVKDMDCKRKISL
uniref:Plant cell wall protein SlTFR88 n=1 Tax=Solanum tuberosum TaxID=4113 RepID=M1DPV6_SOLTU